jgi:hypothetical protein
MIILVTLYFRFVFHCPQGCDFSCIPCTINLPTPTQETCEVAGGVWHDCIIPPYAPTQELCESAGGTWVVAPCLPNPLLYYIIGILIGAVIGYILDYFGV